MDRRAFDALQVEPTEYYEKVLPAPGLKVPSIRHLLERLAMKRKRIMVSVRLVETFSRPLKHLDQGPELPPSIRGRSDT